MLKILNSLTIVCLLLVGSTQAQTVLVSRPPINPIDNDNGIISGESNRFGDFRGIYPADHFALTATTTLASMDVFGTNEPGNSVAFLYDGFTVSIFADNMGQPVGLPYDPSGNYGSTALVYLPGVDVGAGLTYLFDDDGETNVRIDFTTANGGNPITLPAGEYWVSVVPRMPDTPVGDPSGRWNWQMSQVQPALPPKVIDSNEGTWFDIDEWVFGTPPGSSFAWELVGEPLIPVDVTPATVEVTQGNFVSGTVVELSESDDSDFSSRRSSTDVQSRVVIEMMATSPTATPSEMTFTLEASVFARTQVGQSVDLFNYDTDSWEEIDSRAASRFTDSTATISATGDLSRFVDDSTDAIQARIRYQSTNSRQQFSSNVDQAIWTIQ